LWDYFNEKRDALTRWSDFLDSLQCAGRSVASKKSIVACNARRLALRVSSGLLPMKL
jgi:hypothetical protein